VKTIARSDAPVVIHVDEAAWKGNGTHAFCAPELQGGTPGERWPQFGVSVDVLEPGEGASYHRELWDDETFLVLAGVCDLVIEGELHRIGPGTFVHCPAGTAHVFVGAGDGPCQLVMFGARGNVPEGETWGEYVPNDIAAGFGLAVDELTSDPKVAYAGRPPYGDVPPRMPFTLERSTEHVLVSRPRVDADDWFIVHVDEAVWVDDGNVATLCLDGPGFDREFQQYGVNVRYIRPGRPACAYHSEHPFDEVFLVLDGHGIALVDGVEHPVRAGSFVVIPSGTEQVLVAASDSHLVALMFGTRDFPAEERGDAWIEYPVNDAAARFGASVATITRSPAEAYADWPESEPTATPPWTWRTR
jgi:uncharacterized cupin superfamily protein